MMCDIIYSNNPMFMIKPLAGFRIEFSKEKTALDVLISARDQIHKNHKLLTHPLHSNIKPTDTLYRSVVISSSPGTSLDLYSLELIETAITAYKTQSHINRCNLWSDDILKDLQLIDYDLIRCAIEK